MKKNHNRKKNIISIMVLLLILISGVIFTSATSFSEDQTLITNEINNAEIQNSINPDVLIGSASSNGYSMSLTSKPVYIGITTHDVNGSKAQITYRLQLGGTLLTKYINLTPNHVYYLRFSPNNNPDFLNFQINNIQSSSVVYTIFSVNDNTRAFSKVTTTIVGSMNDLIQINIGFWKIIYYLFIFSIIIGSIGLLVNFAFRIFDWADNVSGKKKQIFSGKRQGGKE